MISSREKGQFDFDKYNENVVEYERGKHNGKEEIIQDIINQLK